MLQPIEVNDETVPMDVIDRVGPGGSFILDRHTSETFRKTFWFPKFMDRSRFQENALDRKENLLSRLNKKAKDIMESHCGPEIPEAVVAEIKKIVKCHAPDVE